MSAQSPEMQPIEKFVYDNSESSNSSTEVFVGLRCYSIFMLMHVYTKDNGLVEYSQKYYDGAQTFLKVAVESQNPKNQEFLTNQIDRMTGLYKERFLEAKARTGNMSDDPIISADLQFCSGLLSPVS